MKKLRLGGIHSLPEVTQIIKCWNQVSHSDSGDSLSQWKGVWWGQGGGVGVGGRW